MNEKRQGQCFNYIFLKLLGISDVSKISFVAVLLLRIRMFLAS
jgi:hypothetical protein